MPRSSTSRRLRSASETETARYVTDLSPKLRKKLVKVGLLEPEATETPATTIPTMPTTLAAYIDEYIAKRKKTAGFAKTLSRTTNKVASRSSYFGEMKPLSAITVADAEDWRRWMKSSVDARKIGGKDKPLLSNTVNCRCGFARQFFKYAVDASAFDDNPFRELKGSPSGEQGSRLVSTAPETRLRCLTTVQTQSGGSSSR